jgi:hypothetical protein
MRAYALGSKTGQIVKTPEHRSKFSKTYPLPDISPFRHCIPTLKITSLKFLFQTCHLMYLYLMLLFRLCLWYRSGMFHSYVRLVRKALFTVRSSKSRLIFIHCVSLSHCKGCTAQFSPEKRRIEELFLP